MLFLRSLSSNFTERKESDTGIFEWTLQDTLDVLFTEHRQATASVLRKNILPLK